MQAVRGTSERCSHEVEQYSSPFELRPRLIRTDMSNLNCRFRLLNARRRQLWFVYRLTGLRNMRKNIRIMRNSSVLTALFPHVRQGVLAATLGQPDKWWYLSELANRLETSPSSLQRELSSLVASGILVHRREGTRAYFKAETQSPVFRDLQQLFEKTAGLAPILEQMLKPFGDKIQSAFIYGSVARSREHAMSDVDVMVIGRAGLADLSPALRKAEERLGREVNVTAYSPEEFREKIKSRDHFLAAVLRGRKQFVKGSQSDLDEIVGK